MRGRLKGWARSVRRDAHAVYLAARDPRTPWYAKALAICVAGYALSPIDLIPDFIPVIGYLDDAVLVPLGILAVVKLIPPEHHGGEPERRRGRCRAARQPHRRMRDRGDLGCIHRPDRLARLALVRRTDFKLRTAAGPGSKCSAISATLAANRRLLAFEDPRTCVRRPKRSAKCPVWSGRCIDRNNLIALQQNSAHHPSGLTQRPVDSARARQTLDLPHLFGALERARVERAVSQEPRQGADRPLVAFDLPTQTGYDSDHVLSKGEVGKVGVPIAHLGDMRALFADIPVAEMNTSMTINATAPWLLALYIAVADEQGAPRQRLQGTTQNDIVKEYLSRGTLRVSRPRPPCGSPRT
jgi:uncharacterized membrane protein YkvA (DUF1232 family)